MIEAKMKFTFFRKWNNHHKCYGSLDIGCHGKTLGILVLLANFDFGNNNPVHFGNTKIEPNEVRIQYSSIGIIYKFYRIIGFYKYVSLFNSSDSYLKCS